MLWITSITLIGLVLIGKYSNVFTIYFFSMLGLEYPFIDFIKILQSLKLKNQIYIIQIYIQIFT